MSNPACGKSLGNARKRWRSTFGDDFRYKKRKKVERLLPRKSFNGSAGQVNPDNLILYDTCPETLTAFPLDYIHLKLK